MLNKNQPLYLKAETTESFYLDKQLMSLLEEKQWPATNIHSMSTSNGLDSDVTFDQFAKALSSLGLEIHGVEESSGKIEKDETYAPIGIVIVASNEECVTHLRLNGRYFGLSTWAKSVEQARTLNQKIFEQFPQEEKDPNNTVEFKFWKLGPQNHPYPTRKTLICPKFNDIRDNYTQDVVRQVEALIELKAPDEYGKIILWHGPPGNGKTYLIRALAKEWASKHDITPEVIIDPETFFSNSYYLDSLITAQLDSDEEETFRLIIIEDYASIVSTGCRNNPGFARLLNTTDGLIGQGQRLIFLLTTNEPLDMIDPAVLRPGRCLHRMEILPMTEKEGIEWLEKKDALHLAPEVDGKRELSLADLYAILHGNPFKNNEPSSSFGF